MEYKISVLGTGAVGKSALTIQFARNYFVKEYDPTIEDAYRRLVVVDNKAVVVEIIDTAGQEEYTALRDQHLRNCDGFILVYSVTCETSLEALSPLVNAIHRAKDQDTVPKIIVGNKADLVGQRAVSTETGKKYAKLLNTPFLEASAKTRMNVEEVFTTIIREVKKYAPKKNKKRSCTIL